MRPNSNTRDTRRRRPQPAVIIAVLALVMAGVGTAIAAHHGTVSGKQIKKRSEPGNRLKKNTLTGTEVKESSLGQVPTTANAASLQGKLAGDFLAAAKTQRFSVKLSFGQTQTLFTTGPFTFTAMCVQNATDPGGTPNSDFAEILISTSQNGSVFDGFDAKRGGTPADPTTFLNTDTPADERAIEVPVTEATGISRYDAEGNSDGAAFAPDGTAVSFNADGLAGSVNEFGAGCTIDGFALIASG